VRRFAGTDGDGPAGQFLFHVAGDGGGIAGNDDFLMLDLSVMPLFLTNMPTSSPANLPAAQAVSTDSPSESLMSSQVGTLLASISPETMK
jgi:hypothetical protein